MQFNSDKFKIILQSSGDIRWNHIIFDVKEGRFIPNIERCL